MPTLHPFSLRDPRLFQIFALSSILIIGVALRAFEVSPLQYAAVLATALAVQWLGSFLNAIKFEAKSAIISSLSLTLLLRADTLWPLIAGAAIAIGSKFMFRFEGKHIFNPTNIAIVIMIIATDAAWTTPGQWGTAVWFAALIAGAGSFVTYRAARLDVPLIFLGVYAGLVFARALWLGDPLAIPVLRLQNGALILFAFFMISDPKTTPDGARARAFFAAATAVIAYVLQYHFFVTDGLFYALAGVSIVRPLIERFDRARAYQWGDAPEELKPVFRFAKAQRLPAPAE
ncbi:MAG: RnfABCDGE type electron transport complex subunit D [Parvularculaceae bacterium]